MAEVGVMSDYVELHASSAFSFLRGASQPEDLAAEAARLGLPALAIADRDGVYAAARLYQAARELQLRAIVGAEVTLEDGTALPLLVTNGTGYANLCRLISTAKLEPREAAVVEAWRREHPLVTPADSHEDPRARKRPCFATWRELAEHAEGLIALTGDEDGPVLSAWRNRGADAAAAVAARLQTIFGADRLYVELQRRRQRGEDTALCFLADLAAARQLPLLATGGVRYATRAERPIADVFTCLREHTTLDAAGRLLSPNAERHLRSGRAMAELFQDYPEAVVNSLRLAERLDFTLQNLDYRFPDFPVGPGETMESVLREQTYAGARERIGELTPKLRAQLDRELAMINKLGFPGYFLIVWDICQWCHQRGILIQGRGSAANSAVCYALGITAVNPLRYRLLFERFLSEGRVGKDGHPSWPDIDLDLPSGDLRESVIQEIYQRYAPRGAAMVANVITYRGRSAAREIGKVLGLPGDVLDRFSALYANGDFPHTLDLAQQVKLSGLPGGHPRLPAMLALYRQMQGLPRHLGQHSGGMVFCPNRLDRVVPIENASMEGRRVVQWDKDDCEELGLVKVDFLGLGMMAVLQDAFALCTQRGEPLTLHTVPPEDPETLATIRRADTIGVFQVESRAQQATLPRLQPQNFYDVAIAVSIVRPGPIAGRVSHPLIKRRAGEEKVVYLDESVEHLMKPILERTWGVILFQEQMLETAMVLAGFSGAQAEELRRAFGFNRNTARLRKVVEQLQLGMRARGHSEAVVQKVLESSTTFAGYGFPESHAISFALLAYASTWLKVHRPAEFTASLLNNQPMGFYSPATLIQDARRHGLKVKAGCVQRSSWECTVEADDTIRIGLRYVKGLREANVRAMLAQRAARAFTSIDDWLARTSFSAAERRALAAVGALRTLASHRRAALWQVEAAWSAEETLLQQAGQESSGTGVSPVESTPGDTTKEDRQIITKRMPESTDMGGTLMPRTATPLAPMTPAERMHADFRGMNLTVGTHPMALVRERLPDVWRAADLPLGRDGERVKVAGSVICRQRPGTAKGFVFVSLEDETGIANVVVYPDLFEQRRMTINEEPALCIVGRMQSDRGVIHVKAETIEALNLAELPTQTSHDFR
ncbi:DNA polymerase III subunit alpha [Opitutus terrae]|uniref:Error-prone DNA polymerase n=1 Tax=Opitutus terrae (strain DSM 11246 / JCM 15787 / PB90-1) TaxID=452637 RepID=B1ZZZ1_OPITP|nr:error-prone DNA polymerase [Opitutus terrae]ACB77327.1 DNA polymerase III, alpha subunit [Opitutus terrae PB90-1]